jgi:hypothetical protein
MKPRLTKAGLSEPRKRLVELMQSLGHGQIQDLDLRDREPVLDPPPSVVREIKLGGTSGPRPEVDTADFLLKSEVIELFEYFDQAGNGTIDLLVIKHGLPFRMSVKEAVA